MANALLPTSDFRSRFWSFHEYPSELVNIEMQFVLDFGAIQLNRVFMRPDLTQLIWALFSSSGRSEIFVSVHVYYIVGLVV